VRSAAAALLLLAACGRGAAPDPVAAFTRHYVESDPGRPFRPTFLGVPAWQNPMDLWVMQEILTDVRPDFVIETGTAHGGSALYYAAVLDALGGDGRVITVDLDPQWQEAATRPLWQERVVPVTGDSVAPATLARIRELVGDGRVLVTLDSMHTTAHVARELALYADLVSPGSYLVVQDTVIDRYPDWIERYAGAGGSTSGPAPAVAAFLAADPRFTADRAREGYLFTFHPGGFLKRTR